MSLSEKAEGPSERFNVSVNYYHKETSTYILVVLVGTGNSVMIKI